MTGRYNTPASLIYFDLNHLKKTNDTHGHAAGDAVLTHFAAVLLKHVRDSDCVGRLGGDEFGVLLSHANQEQALKKADTLAEALKSSPTKWDGQDIFVSFAYGAFELQSGDNPDTAMARAALDIGFYVSLAGIVTFPRAEALREVATLVPDDRLLIETDAPYLAPVPHRGKRNEPAFVARVAETVAGLRGVPVSQLGAQVARNFDRLLMPGLGPTVSYQTA